MVSGNRAASFKNPETPHQSRLQAPPQSASAECCKSVPHPRVSHGGLFSSKGRVSIYIDGLNFHYGLRILKRSYTDFKFDFAKFITYLVGSGQLIQAYYYNASLKRQMNLPLYREQRRFFARLRKIKGFRVVLCKRQRRVSEEGRQYYTIKGDDIHLAIDMLKDAYEDMYDTAILISGDGDFAPLVRYVRRKGKKVENYHFADNVSRALTKSCDVSRAINKNTANRFFYRGEQ